MNISSRRKKRWIRYSQRCVKCLAFAIAGLLLFTLFTPLLLKSRKKMGMTQAISNARQVYRVLIEFETDYGQFPSDITAAKKPSLQAFTGDSSNAYLGQLIAGGYTKSEEIFFAQDKRFRHRDDDVISPPE